MYSALVAMNANLMTKSLWTRLTAYDISMSSFMGMRPLEELPNGIKAGSDPAHMPMKASLN